MVPPQTYWESQRAQAANLFEQATALYGLRRYADAEALLRRFLAAEPNDWSGHYYLAAALLAQADHHPEKGREALREAQRAVTLEPENENSHFVLAWAHMAARKWALALDALHQGMRANPKAAWGYSLACQVYLAQQDWEKALRAADTGLRYEPEHIILRNGRAEALIMLGRKEDARFAVQEALATDPSSPRAHANHGWLALYDSDYPVALNHFREAMRQDPNSEYARQGLLQSLHARNPLYHALLRYSLWMRRLTKGEFWAGVALISAFNTFLRYVARIFPPLLLIVLPYLLLFSLFTFFTWIGDGFFNLLLRLSKVGRQVLSPDESLSGAGCAFTGLLFLVNLAAFVASFFVRPGEYRYPWAFFVGCLISLAMMVPVSGVFKVDPSSKNRRAILSVIAVLLGMTAACGYGGAFVLTPWHAVPLALFFLGWLLYPWVANLVISVE